MSSDFAPKQRLDKDKQDAPPSDHVLTQELRAIMDRGENMRLKFMKDYRGRSFVTITLSLLTMTIGGSAFGWLFLVHGDIWRALGAMLLALAPAITLIIWSRAPLRNYRDYYKTVFLPRLAEALGNFKFHPTRGISSKILSKTGIVPPHSVYVAEDCFMGRYKNAKIILSEARLKTHKKARGTVFDGIFALIELPEAKFSGHTIMTADAKLAQRMTKLSPLSLRGSGFEDVLACFSSKPEQAERFKQENLLKEIRELIEIYDHAALSIAFFRGKYIFLTIPYKKDMFEPSKISVPITTRETAICCQREISQLLSIVDLMDLYDQKDDKEDQEDGHEKQEDQEE